MSGKTLVITGTDTGVGKTFAACALLHRARAAGLQAAGYKPVASGCEATPQGLRNEDALMLIAAGAGPLPYEQVNPYAFAPPIAPHLAAAEAGVRIDPARLDAAHAALARRHELVLVEGAGGWQVPLGEDWTFADWAGGRGWPVVLVVGIRLGCINHALLSAESITHRAPLAGWIANCVTPRADRVHENIGALQQRIGAPLLGVFEAGISPPEAAAAFSASFVQRLRTAHPSH